jgi:hypothetical protein
MKRMIALLVALTLIFTFTACSGDTVEYKNAVPASEFANASQDEAGTSVDEQSDPADTYTPIYVEYDSDDLDSSWDNAVMSHIILQGDAITVDGDGATVDGSQITIKSAGIYGISGTLNDGQIVVNTGSKETVKLVLDGVDITCTASAPIYVIDAGKTVITLADDTDNYITDGDSYIFEDVESDEPNAAVFSKSDLTINGGGSLTVNANYNNGIQSKDELKITGGNITVNAVNHGIKGRDGVIVRDGTVTVYAGGDGIQSNNDEDSEKGFVAIEGGTIDITAGQDGMQAETGLLVSGGSIAISSGGGSINNSQGDNWGDWGPRDRQNMTEFTADVDNGSASAKGLKAGVNVTITGGIINIDSSDDSIHSNSSLTINGGKIILASGDDGMHSDSTLEINGGDISITKSYEGIESAVITINDGDIHLVASDDGINVAGGNDASSINGRPGQNNFDFSSDDYLYVNGGYIVINAAGDGIDVNGSINMTAGDVIVNGPTSNNNGPLDYLGTFEITGGFLVAAGSAGMAQAPGTPSTQYSVMMTFEASQPAGTVVHFETEDGEEILTFVPSKAYQSVVLSSSGLKSGSTYVVYSGGSSSGIATDGLYSGGAYTAGTEVTSFTISGIVTSAGSPQSGGFPGGMPGGHDFPGGQRP